MTTTPVFRLSRDENPNTQAPREWLVTNGLGGFASATISGKITRRYHGYLIAALPAPFGRMVMLNDIDIAIERPDGTAVGLGEAGEFMDFTLTMGLPSWRYRIGDVVLDKSVTMPARQNIVHVTFGCPIRNRRSGFTFALISISARLKRRSVCRLRPISR